MGVYFRGNKGNSDTLYGRRSRKSLFFAAVGLAGKLALKFFNTSCRVHELCLARVERMANVANIDFQFRFGRLGGKFISATTGNL